jgi:hypothetical protein
MEVQERIALRSCQIEWRKKDENKTFIHAGRSRYYGCKHSDLSLGNVAQNKDDYAAACNENDHSYPGEHHHAG